MKPILMLENLSGSGKRVKVRSFSSLKDALDCKNRTGLTSWRLWMVGRDGSKTLVRECL